jgi:hypothetical protein
LRHQTETKGVPRQLTDVVAARIAKVLHLADIPHCPDELGDGRYRFNLRTVSPPFRTDINVGFNRSPLVVNLDVFYPYEFDPDDLQGIKLSMNLASVLFPANVPELWMVRTRDREHNEQGLVWRGHFDCTFGDDIDSMVDIISDTVDHALKKADILASVEKCCEQLQHNLASARLVTNA